MPRGYRSIVFATVGWLALCGAQPPAKQAQGGNSAQQATPAPKSALAPSPTPTANPSPKFTGYPGYDPDPCYHAEDHDAADLCAQWRAAMAAEKAAHEARRATQWSIVATILSVLGFIALIVTLIQSAIALRRGRDANLLLMKENARTTRRAIAGAADTAEALKAARKSASAAQTLAANDRAWVCFEQVLIASIQDTKLEGVGWVKETAGFWIEWKNSGRSPALLKAISQTYRIIPAGEQPPIIDHVENRIEGATATGPGISLQSQLMVLNKEDFAKVQSRKFVIFIYCRVEYHDTFSIQIPENIRISECGMIATYIGGQRLNPDGTEMSPYNTGTAGHQNTCT
jgi:hypothetical protein